MDPFLANWAMSDVGSLISTTGSTCKYNNRVKIARRPSHILFTERETSLKCTYTGGIVFLANWAMSDVGSLIGTTGST